MKAMLCTNCSDILAPYRDDGRWRWCQCQLAAVRWRDGTAGLLDVAAFRGPSQVRILGLSNMFLEYGINGGHRLGLMAQDWRELHETCARKVGPHYLFHHTNRDCWALIVRVGESADIRFIDYETAITDNPTGGGDAQRAPVAAG